MKKFSALILASVFGFAAVTGYAATTTTTALPPSSEPSTTTTARPSTRTSTSIEASEEDLDADERLERYDDEEEEEENRHYGILLPVCFVVFCPLCLCATSLS